MVPDVLSISRITIVDVVDLPQPELTDEADALAAADREANAVDGAEIIRLHCRLRSEQLLEGTAGVVPGIFLDQLFNDQQRLGCDDVGMADGFGAFCLFLRQKIAQRHAGAGRCPHQLACVTVRRRLEDRFRLGGFDDVAFFHHHNAIAIGGGQTQIMSDEDHRHAAFAGEIHREIHHRFLRGDVKSGCRFVGDE